MSVGDSVTLKSVSGNIEASDIKADIGVLARTTSGNIYLSGELGINSCRSVSGRIELYIYDADSVDVNTTSGDVKMSLLECPGYYVEFDSVSGEYTSDHSGSVSGNKYYSGDGSLEINVETVSGDLTLAGVGTRYD